MTQQQIDLIEVHCEIGFLRFQLAELECDKQTLLQELNDSAPFSLDQLAQDKVPAA